MPYRVLADAVVVLHLAFVGFAVLGGLLALRWRRTVWFHLPACLWAVLVELTGWYCPLTPLEVGLRTWGGEAGYEGGFVEHYLIPILYPAELTRGFQIGLGLFVLSLNALIYFILVRRWISGRRVATEADAA